MNRRGAWRGVQVDAVARIAAPRERGEHLTVAAAEVQDAPTAAGAPGDARRERTRGRRTRSVDDRADPPERLRPFAGVERVERRERGIVRLRHRPSEPAPTADAHGVLADGSE